jgi:hypothetical protein
LAERETEAAKELARVAELKNQEAVEEAKAWARVKLQAEERWTAAKEAADAAKIEMVRGWFIFVFSFEKDEDDS